MTNPITLLNTILHDTDLQHLVISKDAELTPKSIEIRLKFPDDPNGIIGTVEDYWNDRRAKDNDALMERVKSWVGDKVTPEKMDIFIQQCELTIRGKAVPFDPRIEIVTGKLNEELQQHITRQYKQQADKLIPILEDAKIACTLGGSNNNVLYIDSRQPDLIQHVEELYDRYASEIEASKAAEIDDFPVLRTIRNELDQTLAGLCTGSPESDRRLATLLHQRAIEAVNESASKVLGGVPMGEDATKSGTWAERTPRIDLKDVKYSYTPAETAASR